MKRKIYKQITALMFTLAFSFLNFGVRQMSRRKPDRIEPATGKLDEAIGTGTGAGSVYVQGRDTIELVSGSEITIRAGAPRS